VQKPRHKKTAQLMATLRLHGAASRCDGGVPQQLTGADVCIDASGLCVHDCVSVCLCVHDCVSV
jgi:hypothetical protein